MIAQPRDVTDEPLIACVDVDYRGVGAVAAALWFRGWGAASAEAEAAVRVLRVAEYEPGEFYRRELPCLLEVLKCGPRPDAVVVDGYVWLGGGSPGLGARLQDAIGGIVVGVAKTRFAGAEDAVAVCRGGSRAPLFVTSIGMPTAEAAVRVAGMHGPYRIPMLLKQVDALARSAEPNADEGNA